jgi:hypothetical protein
MPDYLFDTTVLIDYLRGVAAVRAYIQIVIDQPQSVSYSVVTEAELWAGIRDDKDEQRHLDVLSRMKRLDVTSRVARVAGRWYGQHRAHGLALPNALIAATAQVHQKTLLTRNSKHFTLVSSEVTCEFYTL